ncbi:MAG: hypothetical protein A2487_20050 [Candidatus Raymondbacteria bacterium RifOxyC12_full_50_8]|uniref:Outer membrane protein beta-barrel domain-containing protein n=1 Tax=Candidatus Raymondbacteria bacterium RIFOXYD12_FULL_49_13 TaxID=1817890 RepID=A0A1F7F3F3_UNCRA|nr:MAG: hypothetical protein A2248_10005 [Candidatus Raymondbacteria bacterium RIFOXYA2_FULL_49_16]OGJ86184.1 MAG: hypothetical protein A2350_18725 [Candidatus Raymondbacteria bacterium RifOxyB12_full_50_8]OGK01092.1 MAG: hypothetical protein A2519_20255 [Candidatus Raymondbacteria bacterium RIFOXYD12_FULL_49_13]OGK02182.1 MAG: hypothetical protein A2487_20050 [Candidatus Raymondbacteria bacterium RifOxyC12_full_50_8]OGP39302.1 MAG: hypothetical protein A2324_02385 [Candidatus Raymondbacteria b
MKLVVLLFLVSILYAQEAKFKNYFALSSRGIEYGRHYSDKLTIAVAVNPDLTIFSDSSYDKYTTSEYNRQNDRTITSFSLAIPIRYSLVNSKYLSLHGLIEPSAGYDRSSTKERTYNYLDFTNIEVYRCSKYYFADLKVGLEPCFKPIDRVEFFWSIVMGMAYSFDDSDNPSSYDTSKHTRTSNYLRFIGPHNISIVDAIGIKFYF